MIKLIFAGIVVALSVIVGVASYFYLGPDNPIEEECEAIIQAETGANIDLSQDQKPTT
jgi:uncharacterized protein YpmB